ncbi:beta-hexosaminidase 2 [Fusarium longipes]|uniref:beta-N-acetylhexosaminidase n=1 Tax=Fusarium longipes TaxID=694270 RepID=A0A395T9E1_9HYPO|nr:beta-hexosaminidase 2 [Fusarium longipes]
MATELYPHRGFMLDTGRKFFPVKVILQMLAMLHQYNFNNFHWHIYDAESFPIMWPENMGLTNASIKYSHTSSYYTFKDIEDVVLYGRNLGINVYPETDIPGHADIFGVWRKDLVVGKTSLDDPDAQLDIRQNRPKTAQFVSNLVSTFDKHFDSPLHHFGGDEVAYFWNTKDDNKLFNTFLNGLPALSPNKSHILWDDPLTDSEKKISISKDWIIQTWHNGATQKVLKKGHRVIVSESNAFYIGNADADTISSFKFPNDPKVLGFEVVWFTSEDDDPNDYKKSWVMEPIKAASKLHLVCARCWRDFFNTKAFEQTCTALDYAYAHYENVAISTIDEIKNASSSGCNWCSFVATYLDDSKPGKTQIKVVLLFHSGGTWKATPMGRNMYFFRIYYVSGEDEVNIAMESLYAFTTTDDKASQFVTARPLQTDVGSKAACRQIQTWLEECKGHEKCCNLHTEARLPTRVIEVSPSYQQEPRIIESRGLKGSYATLSYCWGKDPFLTLNTSNYAQCVESLDITRLPLTFQNAITVTRNLSIPYLWIDALCIVQDSEDDKDREISSMKDVYARSALTLVAASAVDVSEGFLQNRPCPRDIFTIPFCVKPDVFGSFTIGKLDAIAYDERSEPLAKRAWTLQEQVLAQRAVIFAKHTLIWDCKSGARTWGDSFHYPYQDEGDKSWSLNINKLVMDEEDAENYKYDALTCWCRLVSAYSLRLASFENDKLNAIAGVAQLPSFASILGPGYFAGMWQYNFALQLTWYVADEYRCVPGEKRVNASYRPNTYRAPSWSWVSIEGAVIAFNDIFAPVFYPRVECEILECSTTPKSDNSPYGEIVSAHLKIRTVLRVAWFFPQTSNLVLIPVSDGDDEQESIMTHQEAHNQYNKDFVKRHPDVDLRDRPEVLHGGWLDNTVGVCDEARFTEPMLVSCIAIASDGLEANSMTGLLLVDAGDGSYTRVGQFMQARKRDFRNKERLIRDVIVI